MKPIKVIVTLLLFICFLSVILGQTGKKPLQLADLRKIVNVSDPQISPDGNQIAVIVSRYDWDKDTVKQDIELVDISSSSKRSLTFQRIRIVKNWVL